MDSVPHHLHYNGFCNGHWSISVNIHLGTWILFWDWLGKIAILSFNIVFHPIGHSPSEQQDSKIKHTCRKSEKYIFADGLLAYILYKSLQQTNVNKVMSFTLLRCPDFVAKCSGSPTCVSLLKRQQSTVSTRLKRKRKKVFHLRSRQLSHFSHFRCKCVSDLEEAAWRCYWFWLTCLSKTESLSLMLIHRPPTQFIIFN